MKKTLTLLLTSLMILSLCACGKSSAGDGDSEPGLTVTETVSNVSGHANTSVPEVTPAPVDLDLNTEDLLGYQVSNELIKDAKLVLVNLWEPWCGPCVNEMPDLQKIYDKYCDKGLVIIGAYSSVDMQSEAEAVVEKNGITYPIVKVNDYLAGLEQDYVPATYAFDGDGNLLYEEPIPGAQSYENWDAIVKSYFDQ